MSRSAWIGANIGGKAGLEVGDALAVRAAEQDLLASRTLDAAESLVGDAEAMCDLGERGSSVSRPALPGPQGGSALCVLRGRERHGRRLVVEVEKLPGPGIG